MYHRKRRLPRTGAGWGVFLRFKKRMRVASRRGRPPPPFVLNYRGPPVQPESLIRRIQFVEFGHGRLNQSRQRNRLLNSHRHVAYPELEGIEEWMRSNVPPDLLRVINAVRLDQQLDEVLVLAPAREIIGDVRAWEFVEYFAAVGFQPRIHPQPERRISRQRQNMPQKVPRVIHHVDRGFTILNPDVYVQPKDQICPLHELQILNNILIALVRMKLQGPPIVERMRCHRSQPQSVC